MSGAVRLVVAADWSVAAAKRQMAIAVLDPGGRFRAEAARPVGDPRTLLARVARRAGRGAALVGFDFPIGVPRAYAERAGVDAFVPWARAIGRAPWDRLFTPAGVPSEIGVHQPFYPIAARRKGEVRRAHLCAALGVGGMAALLRRCDAARPGRPAAEALFWTLGGKQVGKAAIAGWRDVILPALAARPPSPRRAPPAPPRRAGGEGWDPEPEPEPEPELPGAGAGSFTGQRDPDLDLGRRVSLWPFDGPLADLLAPRRVVLAEIYPADAHRHLDLPRVSKRDPASRRDACAAMTRWMAAAGVVASRALAAQLADGFGPRAAGEDAFDAVAGLLGMLDVVLGRRSLHEPGDPVARSVEGWILGLDAGDPRRREPC